MNVDVAIIGSGTAGLTARRAALKEGATIVMIENGPYGTTCARVGCMPSKLLIHPAELAHNASNAKQFGLNVDMNVDSAAVMRRVRAERDRFVGFVNDSIESMPAEQKLRGTARFIDDTTLDVDGTRVEARAVVIATGSSNWIPPLLREHEDHVLTNESVFELEELPESVALFGMGVIGLELGQAMHRLGVRVAFFDPTPGFGFVTDPVVRASISEVLSQELRLYPESDVQSIREVEGGLELHWTDAKGQAHTEVFEKAVSAAGRRPNLSKLGLENTSVTLDQKGLLSFDPRTMQVQDKPIFVAGDANGDRQLLHEAADEGKAAGFNAASYPQVRAHHRRAGLAITFTDPQIAIVGPGWAALNHDEVEAGEVDYGNQGRARVMGKNAGKVRIYGTRRCGFLAGAELFGPRVEHTAHLLAWATQKRVTVAEALDMPFYHPVVEEGIRTALRDLQRNLKLNELPCPGDELRDGPGC